MANVRSATRADVVAMGHVHVRAWQQAYRGLMPDGYLDGLEPADRTAYWDGVLQRPGATTVLVAERGGVVVGFAGTGPARGLEGTGELYVLNVDPGHWGHGAGGALLEAAQAALAGRGYADAVLWVVTGNARARRFYERAGWTCDGAEQTSEIFGVAVSEVRYRRRLPPALGSARSSDPAVGYRTSVRRVEEAAMEERNIKQEDEPGSNTAKDPDDWVTADEPATGAQRSYLQTLAEEAGEQVPDDLTKAEASKRIDELQSRTGRGG